MGMSPVSSGTAKTILQGTVKGGRRQGRQRTRWEDNSREWTGLEFAKSQRAVENREKSRKLFAKSSVVPQRPSRLSDRMMMKVFQRYILKDGKKVRTYDWTASSEFDSCGKLGLCPNGRTGLHWSRSLAKFSQVVSL